MSEVPNRKNSFGDALLREDPINEPDYKEYRMNLELALNRAERFERITFHVCWVTFLLSWCLAFVGGTKVVGGFDPYDQNATPLSIALGVVYVITCIAWPLSLASLYSRFRPRIREIKEEINTSKIDQLQQEVEQLREKLGE